MIKVMIVDDEDIVIEDLKNLILWEENGFQIVAAATNARTALELYERYRPEILIVDIRMPGMDGLELCRRILEKKMPVRILLLTAYKDFDYAKKAIAMGISNYLLKHEMNEAVLLLELKKVRSELENDEKRLHIIRNQVFTRALKGYYANKAPYDDWKYISDPCEIFTLLLIQVDKPFPIINTAISAVKISLEQAVKGCICNFPEFANYIEAIEMEEGNVALVISMKKVCSQKIINEKLLLYASELQKQIRKSLGTTVAIAITSLLKGMECLAPLYENAVKTLHKSVFYGRGKIFLQEESEVPQFNYDYTLDEFKKLFNEATESKNLPLLFSSIDQAFNTILECKNILLLDSVCKEMAAKLDMLLRKETMMTFESMVQRDLDYSRHWYSAADISKWFKTIITDIMNEITNSKYGHISNITRQALHYIENHYREDLSVEKLAETLGLSRVYLGQLFKKETGFTFLEYLTAYRINIAKRMLSCGNYKIYEVAEKIGYKTSQYFSEVFRKITGVNPLDYRDRVESYENEH